jgi:trans-aconitate methyltransferase
MKGVFKMERSSQIKDKMENIFQNTCGSWLNCTDTTIQAFLDQCEQNNIDPQFCMSWVEQHKSEIPEWVTVSKVSLEWVKEHTSTGSPNSFK